MPQLQLVAEYGGYTLDGALDLPCDLFALARKHAVIKQLEQSEEGRQYLADCERLTKTAPDFEKLRSMKGYRREDI